MQRRIIFTLFFLSGMSALIYQVAWTRQATLIFGVSIYAYSMVLAAFMGGMGLGSFGLRRLADHAQSSLRLYALLQIGIALYGFGSPWLLQWVSSIYAVVAPTIIATVAPAYVPMSLGGIRLLLAGIILLPPTVLMGATLPIMAAAIMRPSGQHSSGANRGSNANGSVGNNVGRLYAIDTLGAALGSFTTGLFLLRILGTRETIWLAASINLLCTIIAWRFGSMKSAPTPLNSSSILSESSALTRQQQFLLLAYTLSGFIALGYEIVWARILAIFTLNAIFSFAIMVTAFLLGLTIGGQLAAWGIRRYRATPQHFGALQLLIGIAAISTLYLFAYLPSLTLEDIFGATTLPNFIAFEFMLGILTLFLPTTLLGMLFPIAVSLYTGESADNVGSRIGTLNALNTAGAIAGALLTGFFIIPWLGLKGTIILFGAINLLIGVATFWQARTQVADWWQLPVAGVAIGAILMVSAPAGYYLGFREGPSDQLVFYAEGVETTVAVFEVPAENFKVSFVNGRIEVPTDAISMRAFRLLGHLPALLRPTADNALMLSFGNGIATGSLNRHQIPQIDAVDLSAEQFAAAELYWIENYNVLASPWLRTHVEDGRNYLLQTSQRYDIITTDATHPVNTSSWALFTHEFYVSVANHLTDEGVFMQWMPFHSLLEQEYKAILRTFQQVFPHATLWYTGGSHTLLLATPYPLTEDALRAHLQAAAEMPIVNDDLGAVIAIREDWIMDEDTLRAYSGGGSLVTDNNAYFFPYTVDTERILNDMTQLRTNGQSTK